MAEILEIDLLAFERGDAATRKAVVDGVRRSLVTGFVYCCHDLGSEAIDAAYAMLQGFFRLDRETKERYVVPGSMGQAGYTGIAVETAAGADVPDWKEMLNWGAPLPEGHPLRRRFPHRYMDCAFPEALVPGITEVLARFHASLWDLQRRFLRILAVGLDCAADYFDGMLRHGPTLTRAIRYPPMRHAPSGGVWAAEHGDINLVTALPRATARGLQVKTAGGYVDAAPPDGCAIINTGLMLEHLTNGLIPAGIHRVVAEPGQQGERLSVVQFCHPSPWTVLAPIPTCVAPGHPPRASAVMAGDWLDEVLYEINLVESARRVQ